MASTTTKTLTLVNTFHGTEYATRKTREELDAIEARIVTGQADVADRALARKIRRALCGTSDCRCSRNTFGERP